VGKRTEAEKMHDDFGLERSRLPESGTGSNCTTHSRRGVDRLARRNDWTARLDQVDGKGSMNPTPIAPSAMPIAAPPTISAASG
jgi:hypothetical protein